jgi:general secretion pathway protein C
MLVRNLFTFSLAKKNLGVTIADNRTSGIVPQENTDFMSYSPILLRNPFGRPAKLYPLSVAPGSQAASGGLPENLLLVGTVKGPDELSFAIFEDTSKRAPFRQEVVRHGGEVLEYGTLSRIEPDSVEVRQQGKTFTIPIVPLERNRTRQAKAGAAPDTSLARKVGNTEYILNREKVEHSLENPEKLLTDARLLPHFRDGKQEGFRMFEVKRGGIYESLGLKNGDILLRVNDLEIANPEVAIQAMTALRGMDRVNLDIIRRGDTLSMTYEIR